MIEHILSKITRSLINIKNFKNQSALHVAILNNNENAVQQLLAAGK